MELSERLLIEIAGIFRNVQYGQITFKLSPEKKTLDYTVQTTGKLSVDEQIADTGYDWRNGIYLTKKT